MTAMTPRQRWLAFWDGEQPDRIPCDFCGSEEIMNRVMTDLQCHSERELWEALGVDKCVFLAPHNPRAKEVNWHIPSLFSVWNIESALIPYMDGLGVYWEAVSTPLAFARDTSEIERFPWPEPEDWKVNSLRAECLNWAGYPICGASYDPFYLYCRLRGMEQALEDLLHNQPIVDAIMERIFEVHAGIVRNVMKTAGDLVDFVYVAEDTGPRHSQRMSSKAFRRSIKPWLKKMIDLVHSFGARVFFHSDGASRTLLPDLIEMGIDVLSPMQWCHSGMKQHEFARDFGKSVVLHGGIDDRKILPFGSPEDVRQQVSENIRAFRDCKGYVVAPCRSVQINTPTANLVALYAAINEFGRN
jgi:uroporphyrinogen decarboxylase